MAPELSRSDALLLAAAGGVVLAVAPFLLDPFSLPKVAVGAWGCAAAAWAAAGAAGRARLEPGLWGPFAALAAAWSLSLWFSQDPWPAFSGQHRGYAWGGLGLATCLCALMLGAASADGFGRRLAPLLLGVCVPVSLYALAQRAGLDPLAPGTHHRPYSTLGGPVHLGAFLALCAPLAADAAFNERAAPRRLGWAAILLGAPALILTGSRGAWLAAAVGLGVRLWSRRRNRETPHGGRASGGVSFSVVSWFVPLLLAGLALAVRQAGRDAERWDLWRSAAAMWVDHPWLGVGPDAFGTALRGYKRVVVLNAEIVWQQDAHNDWLQVLATMGLFGSAAYAWLHAAAARALWRRGSQGFYGVDAAWLGTLAAWFIQAKLNTGVWSATFLAALAAGHLFRDAPHGGGASRGARSVVLALGSVCAVCAGWLVWADHQAAMGVRARAAGRHREAAVRLERAVALDPGETLYRVQLVNLLWDAAQGAPDGARRLLLARAAETAAEGVRRRPADSASHQVLGRAELFRHRWGVEDRLAAARSALERAHSLDPHFPQVKEDLAAARALELVE